MGHAISLLESMSQQGVSPNIVTYSAIIKGYCQEGRLDVAFQVLETMKQSKHLRPDELVYNTLMDGCARQNQYSRGIAVLKEMEKAGVPPSNFTLSVLVKLSSRDRSLQETFDLCKEVASKYNIKPNVHVRNNLIQACIIPHRRCLHRGLAELETMLKEGVRPDTRTYTLLLRACVAAGAMSEVAGLVRGATGLPGAPEYLARPEARLQGGLSRDMIAEVLMGMSNRCGTDAAIALQLFQELKTKMPGLRLDPKLAGQAWR